MDRWPEHQSANPLSLNDVSDPLTSCFPTIFISILAQIDIPVTWLQLAVSTAFTMTSKKSGVAPVALLSLHAYPDTHCIIAMMSSVLGLNQAYTHFLSPTAIDKSNAALCIGGHLASQGDEVHCDHQQLLARCVAVSLGETHFQIPSSTPC